MHLEKVEDKPHSDLSFCPLLLALFDSDPLSQTRSLIRILYHATVSFISQRGSSDCTNVRYPRLACHVTPDSLGAYRPVVIRY